MFSKEIDFTSGEEIVDSWPLLYVDDAGIRFTGRCIITDHFIYYDVRDVDRIARKVSIRRACIDSVETYATRFKKIIELTLNNGVRYQFCYRGIEYQRLMDAFYNKNC